MKRGVRRAASITRLNMSRSGDTCCKSGPTRLMPGPRGRSARQLSTHPQCSCRRHKLLPDRSGFSTTYIGSRGTVDHLGIGCTLALLEPSFHFRKVPGHASCCKVKSARKLAALLHLVNACVSERHDPPQLPPPD